MKTYKAYFVTHSRSRDTYYTADVVAKNQRVATDLLRYSVRNKLNRHAYGVQFKPYECTYHGKPLEYEYFGRIADNE